MMEQRRLGKTCLQVSALSFGASALGGAFRDVTEADAIAAVHAALDAGINHFDVAPAYGGTRSETVLGKALKGITLLALPAGRPALAASGVAAAWHRPCGHGPGGVSAHQGPRRQRPSGVADAAA